MIKRLKELLALEKAIRQGRASLDRTEEIGEHNTVRMLRDLQWDKDERDLLKMLGSRTSFHTILEKLSVLQVLALTKNGVEDVEKTRGVLHAYKKLQELTRKEAGLEERYDALTGERQSDL